MKVYALVGKSGTGKSYHSMDLCTQLNIEAMIDDGLLIYKNNVVAGKSAKRAETKIGAVKTALFTEEEHANDVRKALKETDIDKILVLGTSDRMVEKIVDRLDIPRPDEVIHIEDITTEEERSIANKQRETFGKHVIPASTFQIRRDFAGYFMDPLQLFRDVADKALEISPFSEEKTVVRPTFSYLGRYFISDKVIENIIDCVVYPKKKNITVLRVIENSRPDNMIITVIIRCRADGKLEDTAKELQKEIYDKVEMMTAFNIDEVNVEIKEVTF